MAVVVDLSGDTGSGGFEPIPKGRYHCAITDLELAESGPKAKHPGSNYVKVEFTVQEGEYENRKLWTNASCLPQALFTLKGILQATGREMGSAFDVEEWIEDGVGDELYVIVAVKAKPAEYADFEGQMQNVVKSFSPLDGGTPGAAAKPSGPAAKKGKKDPLLP